MTTNNSTQSKSMTLPVSNRPLMDYENLKTINRKVFESLEISSASGSTVDGPDGDLFEHPIQVVVLGIDDDRVRLGFYGHPSLIFKHGSPPNRPWRKAWGNDLSARLKKKHHSLTENQPQVRMPLHPIIQCATSQDTEDCMEILERTAAILDLLSYLDFSNDEINVEAANGLFYINSMVEDTVKYVNRNLESK